MLKPFAHAALGALGVLIGASAAQAAAGSVVHVTLWDKGASAAIADDKGIGMTGDTTPATMGLKLSVDTVAAGDVTFEVTNSSKDTVHEMVVFPYKNGEVLPYSEDETKIDEDAAGHLGEVSELEPGKSGALRVPLESGKYVLACNIANHYMNGMWAMLTVQ